MWCISHTLVTEVELYGDLVTHLPLETLLQKIIVKCIIKEI